jgi:hypothetical protein
LEGLSDAPAPRRRAGSVMLRLTTSSL